MDHTKCYRRGTKYYRNNKRAACSHKDYQEVLQRGDNTKAKN